MIPGKAATEDTLELDEQERMRLQKAIQAVAARRNGEIRFHPVAKRANLSTGAVREALKRAAATGPRIEAHGENCWTMTTE